MEFIEGKKYLAVACAEESHCFNDNDVITCVDATECDDGTFVFENEEGIPQWLECHDVKNIE